MPDCIVLTQMVFQALKVEAVLVLQVDGCIDVAN